TDGHPATHHHIPFFFSSRRRHTRFSRDWSSDVCSSDLPGRTCRDTATVKRYFNCIPHILTKNTTGDIGAVQIMIDKHDSVHLIGGGSLHRVITAVAILGALTSS